MSGKWSECDLITEDGINHGRFRIKECISAIIEECEDGHMQCAWLWSGGTCDECMQILEGRMERYEDTNDSNKNSFKADNDL